MLKLSDNIIRFHGRVCWGLDRLLVVLLFLIECLFDSGTASIIGILEVVSNPLRVILENWLCDSNLVNPTGIDRVLTEKDLLADSYSDLEASILEEKEFLLLKVISTLPELSCLICS